jgi:hypothetical protein
MNAGPVAGLPGWKFGAAAWSAARSGTDGRGADFLLRRHDERSSGRGGSRADGDARARRRILGGRGRADEWVDMGW